jgi:integrase
MHTTLFVVPTLVRLLYSTGLRISEALSVRNEDVNLAQKVIIIRKTKNGEQRLAPLSDTMLSVLEQYIGQRNKMPVEGIGNPDSFLFVSLTGKACVAGSVYNWFRKILDMCSIPHAGNHHGPRVHDLRHTCAVHSLVEMNRNGMDMYCSLPLLSTFLGHKSIAATEQYVRLTADMYPNLICQQQKLCSYVFPKSFKSEEYGNN